MGLDGGTFATRADLLRRASWKLACADDSHSTRGGALNPGALVRTVDAAAQADLDRIRWAACALSGEPLVAPVVACGLGSLYNKESLLGFLLGTLEFPYNNQAGVAAAFGHLRGLRDVLELTLAWRPADHDERVAPAPAVPAPGTGGGAEEASPAPGAAAGVVCCPITGAIADGRQTFVALGGCGHVLSLRAVKAVLAAGAACPLCGVPFESGAKASRGLVAAAGAAASPSGTLVLNGTIEQLAAARAAMEGVPAEKKKKKKRKRVEGGAAVAADGGGGGGGEPANRKAQQCAAPSVSTS
jgi:hypothetical protein